MAGTCEVFVSDSDLEPLDLDHLLRKPKPAPEAKTDLVVVLLDLPPPPLPFIFLHWLLFCLCVVLVFVLCLCQPGVGGQTLFETNVLRQEGGAEPPRKHILRAVCANFRVVPKHNEFKCASSTEEGLPCCDEE